MNCIGITRFGVKGFATIYLTTLLLVFGISAKWSWAQDITVKSASQGFADFGYKEGPVQYLGSETVGVRQAIEDFQLTMSAEYILSPGDVVYVDVFNHEELSGTFTIGPDGKKTLPVAGVIQLAGLTREQAGQRISQALAPQYQTQITASVRVEQYVGNRFTITGGVSNPGPYQFSYRPTLLDLISSAGGIPAAQTKPSGEQAPKPYTVYCTVVRGDERLSMVDISRLIYDHDLTLNFYLQQGDAVHIHQLKTSPLYIMGEVRSPGYYNVSPNSTLLDALTQAGSITNDAAKKRIHVVHMRSYTHEIVNLFELTEPDAALDIVLEPGDVVYVPRNWLAVTNYWLSQIFGFLTRPIGVAAAAF